MNNTEKVSVNPTVVKEDVNSCRKVSRRILWSDGNLLRLSLATMVCIIALMFPIVIGNAALYLALVAFVGDELVATAIGGLVYALSSGASFIFLTLPSIHGTYLFAKKTVDGERPLIGDMLSSFSSSTDYCRSISAGAIDALGIIALAIPAVGGVALIPTVWTALCESSVILSISAVVFIVLATLAAVCAAVFLTTYFFFFESFAVRGIAPRKALAFSVRMSRGRKIKITEFMLGFFGHVLLSVLSFGLLFVLYTVPLMTVSYFVYTDRFFCE